MEQELLQSTSEAEKQQQSTELLLLQSKRREIIDTPSSIAPTYPRASPRFESMLTNSTSKTYGRGRFHLATPLAISEPSPRSDSEHELSPRLLSQEQREQSQSFPSLYQRYPPSTTPNAPQLPNSPDMREAESYQRSPGVRGSCPAVLEGISSHQMRSLNSIHSNRPTSADFGYEMRGSSEGPRSDIHVHQHYSYGGYPGNSPSPLYGQDGHERGRFPSFSFAPSHPLPFPQGYRGSASSESSLSLPNGASWRPSPSSSYHYSLPSQQFGPAGPPDDQTSQRVNQDSFRYPQHLGSLSFFPSEEGRSDPFPFSLSGHPFRPPPEH